MNDVSSDIRITTDPERAWQLLNDLATNEELYAAVSNRDTVAEALQQYGVELSDDAIPPEIGLPPMHEIREKLRELEEEMRLGKVPTHRAFGHPLCPTVPTHSATFGYVFGVIAGRARPPEE
jgi:hypothetical protein